MVLDACPRDEELCQRLRTGLLAQLEGRDAYRRARELAHEALGEILPVSNDLVTMDEGIYGMYESGVQWYPRD